MSNALHGDVTMAMVSLGGRNYNKSLGTQITLSPFTPCLIVQANKYVINALRHDVTIDVTSDIIFFYFFALLCFLILFYLFIRFFDIIFKCHNYLESQSLSKTLSYRVQQCVCMCVYTYNYICIYTYI